MSKVAAVVDIMDNPSESHYCADLSPPQKIVSDRTCLPEKPDIPAYFPPRYRIESSLIIPN